MQEQIEYIVNLGEGYENELIKQTLRDLEDFPAELSKLKKAWRAGNLDYYNEAVNIPWKMNFPKLYDSLLVERNNNWIPQIENMLETEEVEFILFGTLHLAGEEGIVHQLKARGYSVEYQ